jgi:NTE family protein
MTTTRAIPEELGKIVLVLQGSGALGAYQVGIYEEMHAAGIEPDWVIGTSIGAINAALIAGNPRARRVERLREFWDRLEYCAGRQAVGLLPGIGGLMANWMTVTTGVPGFFRPNPPAFASPFIPLGSDRAGYYSTAPLADTLRELVDFSLVAKGPMRLTVGAANVRTSEMRYFDSRDAPVDARHVMASGALPPAFPAVRIDDALYWDGGILSNTPVEAVLDDFPRRSALIFAVELWNPHGAEPASISEVQNREKDLRFASRAAALIRRQRELHRLRHVVAELGRLLPEADRAGEDVDELLFHGCMTRMHIVRLLVPVIEGEDSTKDIDFSPAGIRARREAGRDAMVAVLRRRPWEEPFDRLEGIILHDAS